MFSFYVFIFWINFVYKKPTNLEEDGSEFETKTGDFIGCIRAERRKRLVFVCGKPRENCNQQHYCSVKHGNSIGDGAAFV